MFLNTYEVELHFFTKDWKRVKIADGPGFREWCIAHPNEYLIAYLGYIQLGRMELQDDESVLIRDFGLCKFADAKTTSKFFKIKPLDELSGMIRDRIALFAFLQTVKPDIEVLAWPDEQHKFEMLQVKDYVPFYHPEFSLKEMMEKREQERRVVYWRVK